MLNFEIMPNGNLKLTACNETRAEISTLVALEHDYWSIIVDLFESESCNGSYTPFDAADANPFVGLTSAPCIAESMDMDDDGNQSIDGRFWFDDDYMINCFIDDLKNKGVTVFTLAA